jgi:hypothetical protein
VWIFLVFIYFRDLNARQLVAVFFPNIFWGRCLYFSFSTHKHKSKTHNSIGMFFLKPYTMAGFEPGSAVSEAAAMSTAPRRQGNCVFTAIIEAYVPKVGGNAQYCQDAICIVNIYIKKLVPT